MSATIHPFQSPAVEAAQGSCLVLVHADAPAPDALLKALGSRGLLPQVISDEPGVMAALAGLTGPRRVVVIVEPQRWERLAELVRAVQTYHHDVLCWQYVQQGGEPGRLSRLDKSMNGPADANGHGGQDDRGEDRPVGQLLGRRRALDRLVVRVPGRTLSTREIVTQQELTMLLGPAPGEAG